MADEYKIICIDEVHFRRDADKRRSWSLIGVPPIVHVNGSFQNTNAYGAYTLDGKFHYKFVERQDSTKTIAFFERLRKKYGKIIFVLDNARWHTSKAVQSYVKNCCGAVKLVFFPKTSPDANPVEECWRQTRNNTTANIAFDSVVDLKNALSTFWKKQQFTHNIINYLCT
jgi:transposase